MELALEDLKNIRIEDFTYDLPEERIAKFPLAEREASKLLIYREGTIGEKHFSDVREILQKGQTLIFNNTRVIHARLFFQKMTGAMIEVFCLEPFVPVERGSCGMSVYLAGTGVYFESRKAVAA